MKNALIISYWIVSILLLAIVQVSFGYQFMESIFIAALYLPGALTVKYFFPKISFKDKTKGFLNAIYITSGVIIAEILLFIIAHRYVVLSRVGDFTELDYDAPDLPHMISNPVFIAIMIAALSVGNYFFEKWLCHKFPSEEKPVTFHSDRKQVSLMRSEILYIESNDSVTTVFATQERAFRNTTPISQWEGVLGEGFMRIHRSFLVNTEHISGHSHESITINGIELPVSRKYKESVKSLS
ncbi:MAG: LytTR family DNA-binding domain-containing protein [Bacteroidia bacterium]|nr:LytTR family DNA-binding domain-containing protein [Bacteroidia bacterium]